MSRLSKYLAVKRGMKTTKGEWKVRLERGDRMVTAYTGKYEGCKAFVKKLDEQYILERGTRP